MYVGTVPCSAASPGAWSRGGAVTGRESVRGGIGPGVEVVPEACDVGGASREIVDTGCPFKALGESGSRRGEWLQAKMLQQSRTHADQSQHQETLERTLGGNVGNAGSRTQSSVPVWILNGMRL